MMGAVIWKFGGGFPCMYFKKISLNMKFNRRAYFRDIDSLVKVSPPYFAWFGSPLWTDTHRDTHTCTLYYVILIQKDFCFLIHFYFYFQEMLVSASGIIGGNAVPLFVEGESNNAFVHVNSPLNVGIQPRSSSLRDRVIWNCAQ